jgi:heptosyltransferase-2
MQLTNPKILVIRYRFLGDTILTVPFFKRLREAYPQAHIAVLIGPQSGELLKNCPYINELIEFDTTRFHKYDSGKSEKKSFWKYAWELRQQKFEIAYVLKRSFSSALLAWLAGIKQRIGFNTEGRSFLLTQKIKFNPKQHEALNFLDHLSSPFNESPSTSERLFWPTQTEKRKAKELTQVLSANNKKVLIHAPAAHPLKMWTAENWAKLVKLLKNKNYDLVFSGSAADAPYYEFLEQLSGIKADLNLCSQENSLRDNIAVYELCDLAICVDSGPMHLAAAVGLPIISLFGPSDPARWHPWSDKYKVVSAPIELSCRPCLMKPTCQDRECLTQLSAEQVFQEVEILLSKQPLIADN